MGLATAKHRSRASTTVIKMDDTIAKRDKSYHQFGLETENKSLFNTLKKFMCSLFFMGEMSEKIQKYFFFKFIIS